MSESGLNPQVTRRKEGPKPVMIAATRDGDRLFRGWQEIAASQGRLVRTFPGRISVR